MIASYSFVNDFDSCPHKAQHKYVLKDLRREAKSDAQLWGTAVHTAFEQRLRSKTPLPGNMEQYEPLAHTVERFANDAGLSLELKLGMYRDGSPCDFWDRAGFLRGVVDVAIEKDNRALILDWKTGKRRDDPLELEIGGLLLKAAHPTLRGMAGAFVWLKDKQVGHMFDLTDTGKTLQRMTDTMEQVNALEGEWPKRPNPLCGWCPVKKCEHNRSD